MSADNPWQLYSVGLSGNRRVAYNDARRDLEKAWRKAKHLVTVDAVGNYMLAVMAKHAQAGAVDTEARMELARRMYVRFGIAAKSFGPTSHYFG